MLHKKAPFRLPGAVRKRPSHSNKKVCNRKQEHGTRWSGRIKAVRSRGLGQGADVLPTMKAPCSGSQRETAVGGSRPASPRHQ